MGNVFRSVRFLLPVCDLVGVYTHWTYMHIFRHTFLSNYWWQKSDIWSQVSYRYPISWEAFLDPSYSYFLFADLGTDHLTWRGGYSFLFRSEFFFRTTQELEFFFFFSSKARKFLPEFNIRLYDKTSESDYFLFPPPKSEYFFQQHWESEYFFRKNYNPHLQVKWSFPKFACWQ